jgi:hypothetical protein
MMRRGREGRKTPERASDSQSLIRAGNPAQAGWSLPITLDGDRINTTLGTLGHNIFLIWKGSTPRGIRCRSPSTSFFRSINHQTSYGFTSTSPPYEDTCEKRHQPTPKRRIFGHFHASCSSSPQIHFLPSDSDGYSPPSAYTSYTIMVTPT